MFEILKYEFTRVATEFYEFLFLFKWKLNWRRKLSVSCSSRPSRAPQWCPPSTNSSRVRPPAVQRPSNNLPILQDIWIFSYFQTMSSNYWLATVPSTAALLANNKIVTNLPGLAYYLRHSVECVLQSSYSSFLCTGEPSVTNYFWLNHAIVQ